MTSTVNPDYWALLGLSPESSQEELKKAFRREARKWHPDLNLKDENAEERFKLINEAYAVLSDSRKREIWQKSQVRYRDIDDPFKNGFPEFDQYLAVVLGLDNNEKDQFEQDQFEQDQFEQDQFDDDIPIGKSEWPTPSEAPPPPVQAYEDIETILDLTPEQAINGANIELELKDGTIVEVKTPPFAGDGWRLRLSGIAFGGKDHFLQLRVVTDDGLRIEGLRVLYKLDLFPPDAVLGCAVDIPTLNGPVTLQVPPQSSSGRLLRLRGRGIEFDGTRGDQIVEIKIVVPDQMGDAERALYGRIQEISLDSDQI